MFKSRREETFAHTPGTNARYRAEYLSMFSYGSPRDEHGGLILVPNSYGRTNESVRVTSQTSSDPSLVGFLGAITTQLYIPEFGSEMDQVRAHARSKFVNKLRKGNASLGVTAASWRQSRDMIANRSHQLGGIFQSAYNGLAGTQRGRSKIRSWGREPLANQVLEGFFGWSPLIQDIGSALQVIVDPIQPTWASASANSFGRRHVRGSERNGQDVFSWNYPCTWSQKVTLSARVQVTNENLWLANRLGLINPASVAWDLVPWSFLVNAFVNVNQIIGSVTEFVGLHINQASRTETTRFSQAATDTKSGIANGKSYSMVTSSSGTFRNKNRHIQEVIPPYPVQTRIPKLNWETAAIASSLMMQKVTRLNNLVRGF